MKKLIKKLGIMAMVVSTCTAISVHTMPPVFAQPTNHQLNLTSAADVWHELEHDSRTAESNLIIAHGYPNPQFTNPAQERGMALQAAKMQAYKSAQQRGYSRIVIEKSDYDAQNKIATIIAHAFN